MVALTKSITIDSTTYAAGTDSSAMPVAVVDRIRNPDMWVGASVPALSSGAGLRRKINPKDLTTVGRARTALGITDGPVEPWVFDVSKYGALSDGTTDDTAAIQAAIDAAVTYGLAQPERYAEVLFPPGVYAIAGALQQGGTKKTNAQLTLPIVPMTENKLTLVLRGAREGSALPIWLQTVPQTNPVTLKSSGAATLHGTYGDPSVLGGPTPQQGYGASTSIFSNCLVVIDGISIMVHNTASVGAPISGFDLRGMAQANVISASALVDRGPTNIIVGGGAGTAFGLAMPWPANNDLCLIGSFSVEGFTYGAHLTEHLSATSIRAIYCYTGLTVIGSYQNSSGSQHIAWIGNASVEACVNGVQFVQGGKAVIDVLSVEGNMTHVSDTNGSARGYIGLGGIINTITVDDPTGVKVIYLDGTSGNATAPSLPTSTTPLRNPFWRDCAVSVSGGTVTAITVDGVATGLTSGTVIVPSGRKIAVTYSSAPTWVWTKL
jgi:hypothetical protein